MRHRCHACNTRRKYEQTTASKTAVQIMALVTCALSPHVHSSSSVRRCSTLDTSSGVSSVACDAPLATECARARVRAAMSARATSTELRQASDDVIDDVCSDAVRSDWRRSASSNDWRRSGFGDGSRQPSGEIECRRTSWLTRSRRMATALCTEADGQHREQIENI